MFVKTSVQRGRNVELMTKESQPASARNAPQRNRSQIVVSLIIDSSCVYLNSQNHVLKGVMIFL